MERWEVRDATAGDGPELLRLRALMFDSIGTTVVDPSWSERFVPTWEQGLSEGQLLGAVVDNPNGSGLVASGIASVVPRLPAPNRPLDRRGYVSSVSTDLEFRRQGMAAAVVARLVERLSGAGCVPVELHATRAGEGIYRALGFVERTDEVELRWMG
jgi:hypothetical protein